MRNFIIRISASFIILFAVVFFPLYFWLPTLASSEKMLFGILISIGSVIVCFALVFINYSFLIKPLKEINKASKKIIGGEYSTRVTLKATDNEILKLTSNLNSIANEFENLEEMRRNFVSNASHELRSPLTSMQGFLHALLDGTISEANDREKYLKIVLSETKRLTSLVNSMLDLSRMESGKYPLNPVRFEINDVIRQIIERFQPTLVKKEVQLDIDFMRDATYVYADKDKIVQVIINLIDNAIKYSPPYSRVLVTTYIHNRKLYVTVKDKGYGISKKDQLLIWDKFYMADKARTPTKSKGTGLGLSIVKKIIDDHKEVIWVESTKGAGATFIFTLTLFDPNKHKISNPAISEPRVIVAPAKKQ